MLGMGSLLLEGTPIRFTGQDSQRAFSHRHAVLNDYQTGKQHIPLNHLAEKQAKLTIMNTMLSELAVLGFEYGFSSADPRNLVVWEAQFGDFVNGAQPIIDQFIAAAESKWRLMNGLVRWLPHGLRVKGPSIPTGISIAFCPCAPKTTCRSAYRPGRHRSSTFYAGRSAARSASRSF